MKKLLRNNKYIKLLIIIDLILCIFLFTKGISIGQDLAYHLSRIDGLAYTMKSGDILSYIHCIEGLGNTINLDNKAAWINKNLGNYGYANGLFYGNLFIYIPAILTVLIGVIGSYKLLIFFDNHLLHMQFRINLLFYFPLLNHK